jgi:hypothetical protein
MKVVRLIAVLLLVGCSTFSKSIAVTGESLDATGRQFVQVAALYKDGCDVKKTIAPDECKKFADFGRNFQKVFPTAVGLWKSARAAGDSTTQQALESKLGELAGALSQFSIMAFKAVEGS